MKLQTNGLDEYISDTWKGIKAAAEVKDFDRLQQEFRVLSECVDLQQKADAIHQRVAMLRTAHTSISPIKTQPEVSNLRKRPTIRPREVRIGEQSIQISINNQIPVAVAEWILKQGKKLPEIHNFIHHTSNGFADSAVTRRLTDGSYMEIGDSQPTLIQKAKKLLDLCGFSHVSLEVHLEDGTIRNPNNLR